MPRPATSAPPAVAADPTVYPSSDHMGEAAFETFVRLVLLPLVRGYLEARGVRAFTGANQFLYWRQFEPTASVAPDLYVVPGMAPDAEPECLKTWETGVAPSFALEIVSKNKRKDYVISPDRYDALGVRELIIYDPKAGRRRDGLTWQVYRRIGRTRKWSQVEHSNEDRVRSVVLGCFLREVRVGATKRLRLATGPRGEHLVPTEVEAARAETLEERAAKERERAAKEQERAAKEQERAAKEQERAAKEQERAAKEQERVAKERERAARLEAETEVARLRKLLAEATSRRR